MGEYEQLLSEADAFEARGNFRQAADCLDHALSVRESEADPFVLLRLGSLLRRLGEVDSAWGILTRAERLDSDPNTSYEIRRQIALVEAHFSLFNAEEGARSLYELVSEVLDDPKQLSRTFNALGIIQVMAGRHEAAIMSFESAEYYFEECAPELMALRHENFHQLIDTCWKSKRRRKAFWLTARAFWLHLSGAVRRPHKYAQLLLVTDGLATH